MYMHFLSDFNFQKTVVQCSLQEAAAAKQRMDIAMFAWYHRKEEAAKASNRQNSEPYLWRPFKDLQVCFVWDFGCTM